MTYKCSFFNSIHGIEIDVDEFSLELYELKIGNTEKNIKEFYIPEVILITGKNQFENSLNWKTYIYNQFEVPEEEYITSGQNTLAYLMKISKVLSNALWMVKDNSVRFQNGHFKSIYNDLILTVDSNVLSGFYTNCLGEKDIKKFSNDELLIAKEYFNVFFTLTKNDSVNVKLENTHAEVNRINRAYYFLDLARANYDIGTKVSLYCSAFECLFSVATTELRHRLSETIANFIADDFDSKVKIYENIKAIYDLRSSVTHGSGINAKLLKNDASKLKEIGLNCDEIMRICLKRIFSDKAILEMYLENDNNKISQFLTELIFK